ncbi:hypothetical protein [Azonexus sp.]|uniref:hypothetical protein n=1 Tax=Azonexus sp. TaxID=1872668 RepID=UPI0027B9EE3D|nr:hypothetical protein [Azonexus sp.]
MTAPALRSLRLEQGGRDLLVLLPGAYMRPEDFVAAGFFEMVETHLPTLDLCAVDLDLAIISSGQALSAVRHDILEPARPHYRQLWLGGISLGGLLALAQAADQPQSIAGLCLLAPYPGSRLTSGAIKAAGGLANWQATAEQLTDPEFRVWHWLKSQQTPPHPTPTAALPATCPVFIGYGTEDRFADGMRQLADCFPPSARHTVPGGHDWPAWQQLWAAFVRSAHFAPHFFA